MDCINIKTLNKKVHSKTRPTLRMVDLCTDICLKRESKHTSSLNFVHINLQNTLRNEYKTSASTRQVNSYKWNELISQV